MEREWGFEVQLVCRLSPSSEPHTGKYARVGGASFYDVNSDLQNVGISSAHATSFWIETVSRTHLIQG